MLERKLFGKIETLPEAVWWDFSNEFVPRRLGRIGPLNLVFRAWSTGCSTISYRFNHRFVPLQTGRNYPIDPSWILNSNRH